MRTERAPTTALSGKNMSEDSLAMSMAIFAASYAVPQPDSVDDPGVRVSGGLFVGLADEGLFRKRGIADARTTKCRSPFCLDVRCRGRRSRTRLDTLQAPIHAPMAECGQPGGNWHWGYGRSSSCGNFARAQRLITARSQVCNPWNSCGVYATQGMNEGIRAVPPAVHKH